MVKIRLIFSPVDPSSSSNTIYIYGDFFKFSRAHQQDIGGTSVFAPEPGIDMFLLQSHRRSDRSRMGDIIPLTDVREIVELVPCYGPKMDRKLDCNNSLDIWDSFYLNNFADKETFHAILTYQ